MSKQISSTIQSDGPTTLAHKIEGVSRVSISNASVLLLCLVFYSDGVGRSGCVSTIMSVIEQVKIEQTVDVFQTIKLIRAKRPGAVDTLVS